MQVNPYLFFNGNCEAALKFYQKVLGAKIEAMLPYEYGAGRHACFAGMEEQDPARQSSLIDGEVIMASDASPGDFHQPQGFAVALQVDDPVDAERRFKALAEGGSIKMPFGKTFFSRGFGMCIDQFGTPWMVNCPMED